jgi:hypothetical protein
MIPIRCAGNRIVIAFIQAGPSKASVPAQNPEPPETANGVFDDRNFAKLTVG